MRDSSGAKWVWLVATAGLSWAPIGEAAAQSYDAEPGQFKVPETYDAPPEEPVLTDNRPWDPRASGQFVCDVGTDYAKNKMMDVVEKLEGGGYAKTSADFVVDPLITAATTEPGEDGEQVTAWVNALAKAGLQLVFPEIGMISSIGNLIIGGVEYSINDMVAGARDQQVSAILGDGYGYLGDYGNLAAHTPFLQFIRGIQRDGRYPYAGLTAENLGIYFPTEEALTAAVGLWEANTRSTIGLTNQRIASNMLVPRLNRMWQLQRVHLMLVQVRRAMAAAIRAGEAQGAASCRAPSTPLASAAWSASDYPDEDDSGPDFEWDTRIRIHGVECFGGAEHAVYTDHFHLNGRFVGVDRREYDRVRAPLVASGAPFCGAWETRRETTTK